MATVMDPALQTLLLIITMDLMQAMQALQMIVFGPLLDTGGKSISSIVIQLHQEQETWRLKLTANLIDANIKTRWLFTDE